MELKIFTRDNCEFCEQLVIPNGINARIIKVDSENYDGFIPDQVPVLQHGGINLAGPTVINSILSTIKSSQDGNYKK